MTDLCIPTDDAHDGSENHTDTTDRAKHKQRKRGSNIPTREQCMEALFAITQMVLLGTIRPAQANAICRALGAILQQHDRAHGSGGAESLDATLFEQARKHPELLNSLAPFFSEEQLDALMGGATDGNAKSKT